MKPKLKPLRIHKRILCLVIFLFCSLTSCVPGRSGLNPGDVAPDFKLQDLQGRERSLSEFKGKVVLLNFWATWCAPCIEEMPDLEKLFSHFQNKNFIVIAVGIHDELESLRVFQKNNNLNFPILFDATGKVAQLYSVTGSPESFFIDQNGKILMLPDLSGTEPVVRIIGPREWASPEAIQLVSGLMK